MCGFIGVFDYNISIEEFTNADSFNLSHRGPDSNVILELPSSKISFFRLAIRDIDGGAQPYQDPLGRFVGTINGELYNELEVRSYLVEDFPLDVLPSGDMQLLAHFIWRYGPEKLNLIDGMFAGFVMFQSDSRVVFFRDRIGEKPLFYLLADGGIIIASEARVVGKKTPQEIEKSSITEALIRGWANFDQQLFSNALELAPGCWGEYREGEIPKMESYWSWPDRYANSKVRISRFEKNFERVLIDEVEKRMVSDVDFCTLLSGGIDSGLLTAVVSKVSSRRLTSFTLGFKDSPYDESLLAHRTAKSLGVDHEIINFSNEQLASFVPGILKSMDLPILDTACISLFALCSEVSKNYKVALTGDGGDELFMGYRLFRKFSSINRAQKYSQITLFPLSALNALISRVNRFSTGYLSLSTLLDRLEDVIRFPEFSPEVVALSPFSGTDIFPFLAKTANRGKSTSIDEPEIRLENYYRNHILPKIYLTKADRMSMAHGLELRAPFLSPKLISEANTIGMKDLVSGPNKKVLRDLASKYLPAEVLSAKKHGFGAPFSQIKPFLVEPEWGTDIIGLPGELCSRVWLSQSENDAIASWSLMVLNKFILDSFL